MPGTLLLVGAMAARPCTGAMMLLAIAWGMGVAGAGAAGVLAMGLGTALFTVAVAVLAVFGRAQALARLNLGRLGGRLVPALQVVAGVLVATAGQRAPRVVALGLSASGPAFDLPAQVALRLGTEWKVPHQCDGAELQHDWSHA